MFKVRHLCFVSLILVAAVQSGLAATITVEKDGSGDYTQIQPALDAAASGDTVLIGPGEFTELTPSFIPGYPWDVEVAAYVRLPNLTIIGAGAGQTILGPVSYMGSSQTYSPKAMVWLEGSERHVSGITFRNCYDGIHVEHGPIFVDGCEFLNNGGHGIVWLTDSAGGWVRNSQFSSNILGNYGLWMIGIGSNISVSSCVFDACEIDIQGIQGISIVNCELLNSRIGLQISAGAQVLLENCHIHDCSIVGVGLVSVAPHIDIIECNISGDQAAVAAYAEATVSATGTIFQGGTDSVFYFDNSGPAEVNDCHLFRNGTYALNCHQSEGLGLVVHDFTRNYWGTIDPETVASWINDQNDDPSNFSIVNFLPMANGPVPTENSSWGSVKAMFR